jgi:outer membrane protein
MKINLLFFILFYILPLKGQSPYFNQLIDKAWVKDENLKAKYFQLESAVLSMDEAKAMYRPSMGFGLQYTLAAGGRTIPFPIGDLFNPVYESLNKVTQTNNFKPIENVEVNFLPHNFYDAKFSVQQPIYYPDLAINKALKEKQLTLKELEIKAYKRLLSKEVMQSAFNVSMAIEAIKVYHDAKLLLSEAKRSTKSMLKNGIALPSSLSRIEAQISDIDAQMINAENNKNNAQIYLMYLCGDTLSIKETSMLASLPEITTETGQREALSQLELVQSMLTLADKKESQFYLPKIGTQLDFGSQAFNFGFTPYALLGLNLQMNLYDGKRHNIRKEMARIALEENNTKVNQTTKQLDLQLVISKNNLQAAIDQANTYQSRIVATKKIYTEVYTKYKEGTSNYLELLDAQSQVTNTSLQFNLAKFNAWQKWAEYIYNSAAYNIN